MGMTGGKEFDSAAGAVDPKTGAVDLNLKRYLRAGHTKN
jgi:hypothetical protein